MIDKNKEKTSCSKIERYLLNIGNATLESVTPKSFYIRLHELSSIKCIDIPRDIELIVNDTAMSPNRRTVDVKTLIESIGEGACLLAVEENSTSSRWSRKTDMNIYFDARKRQLCDRYDRYFDVGLRFDWICETSFIIKYLLLVDLMSTEEIIECSDLIIDTVTESVADLIKCES
jgi:hypothetical protein